MQTAKKAGRAPREQAESLRASFGSQPSALRALSNLKEVITRACVDRAPHRLAGWLREFADHFHCFYYDCYVIHPDNTPQLTQSRLWLVEAAGVRLAIALGLLGVAAPDTI
jgi:arginyl-tRNA synthetase